MAFVVVLTPVLAGCSAREPKKEYIGLPVALSGPNQKAGAEIRRGAELALANRTEPLLAGKKIVLLSNDTDSKPERAKAMAVRMIQANKAIALIGGDPGPGDHEMGWVCQNTPAPQTTPFVSAAGPSSRLTQLGPFVFSTGLSDEARGRALAAFAVKELKAQRLLVLQLQPEGKNGNEPVEDALVQTFLATVKKLGKSVRHQTFRFRPESPKDIRADVKEQEPPEAVLLAGDTAGISGVIRSLRAEVRGNAKILCAAEPELVAHNAEDFEACYFCTAFCTDDPDPVAREFAKRYEAEHKAKPGAFAALGHDAAGMLFEAIRRAESANPDEIREQLGKLAGFKGVSGPVSFAADRTARRPAFIVQLANGAGKLIQKLPADN